MSLEDKYDTLEKIGTSYPQIRTSQLPEKRTSI